MKNINDEFWNKLFPIYPFTSIYVLNDLNESLDFTLKHSLQIEFPFIIDNFYFQTKNKLNEKYTK